MRLPLPQSLLILLLLGSLLPAAEVIDRVAVSIGKDVITRSEIYEQIRLTALQNGVEPDFSPENVRTTAEKLVEQFLLRREIQTTRFAPEITSKQIDEQIAAIRSSHYPSAQAFEQARQKLGLSDRALRRQMEWQLTLIPFIDTRFRSGIPPSEVLVRDYYENIFLPEWKSKNQGTPPPLSDVRDQVEEILSSQRADQALDRWLGQARTQQRIIFHQEAFP
jgi:hypothetical protein